MLVVFNSMQLLSGASNTKVVHYFFYFFGLFPIWGRHITFSISMFFALVLLLSVCTPFSFMSFLITSLHPSFGLPIFQCPPTTIFQVLITTSSSVFLATWSNHLSHFSYFLTYVCHTCLAHISSFLIFSILFIPIIHLNILMSVLSRKLCSAFLRALVSLPYIRTDLLTLIYTAAFYGHCHSFRQMKYKHNMYQSESNRNSRVNITLILLVFNSICN